MKRIASIALLVASAVLIPSLAFAQGGRDGGPQGQNGPEKAGRPDGPRDFYPKLLEGGEAKTVNGTVSVKGRMVTIQFEGKTYQLLSPPRIVEDIGLTDGTAVSLEGQLYTKTTDPRIKSDGVIFVRTITFGGQSYDIVALAEKMRAEMPEGHRGFRGPRGPDVQEPESGNQ